MDLDASVQRVLQERKQRESASTKVAANNAASAAAPPLNHQQHAYDEATMSAFVDSEIQSKFASKKWTALPMYMRWNLVNDYLANDDKGRSFTAAQTEAVRNSVRDKNSGGSVDVEYDPKTGLVTDVIVAAESE
jgi:hypothetical protein